jgi:RNA polymerase sigma factor (TIGR02999 family)
MSTESETTRLLLDARGGGDEAVGALFEHLYPELRALAHGQLRRQGQDGTLATTALVHEAYLKLCDHRRLDASDRSHFFALSARVMRQVLVDHFRARSALKRGGGSVPESLHDGSGAAEHRGETLLALDEALTRLEALDPRLARVVEWKFFGGMTQEEIGDVLGLSPRTVRNDWRKAKAWLGYELEGVT